MTFELKKTNPYINLALAGLVALTVVSAAWLIILYNRNVSAEHAALKARDEMREIESQIAETKERMFSLMNTSEMQRLASERGLVRESNPRYLEIKTQWASASHY